MRPLALPAAGARIAPARGRPQQRPCRRRAEADDGDAGGPLDAAPPPPPPLPELVRPWEADLPSLADMAAPGWPSRVRDWPAFWAMFAAWRRHLARRAASVKRDVRVNPSKRTAAGWEAALRLAPPADADAAGKDWWDGPAADVDATVAAAVEVVIETLPELLAAGVPVPESVEASWSHASSPALDVAWRAAADPSALPEHVLVAHAWDSWGDTELRAWAEKRAAHARADGRFAARLARVGEFKHHNVDEFTDVRMRRRVTAVPGFKREWTHSQIMDVITDRGANVHPDAVPIGVMDPDRCLDYFEEGVHAAPDMVDVLAAAGRLADPRDLPRAAAPAPPPDPAAAAAAAAAALADAGAAAASATLAEPFEGLDGGGGDEEGEGGDGEGEAAGG